MYRIESCACKNQDWKHKSGRNETRAQPSLEPELQSSTDTMIKLSLKTAFSTLGKVQIQASHLLIEKDQVFNQFLLTNKGRLSTKLKLAFNLSFRRANCELDWGRGLTRRGFAGLTNGVTFPQRSNCRVILYQDAHHGPKFEPIIGLGTDKCYKPRKLWEDVFRAINGAKIFIYIAGWSFNPKTVLVRDPQTDIPNAQGIEIGELLKRKADEGVAVRVMIWDDETSSHWIKNQGVMRTHDEQALDYFKQTKVVCRLCPRLHHSFPTLFAHHQKTISMDCNTAELYNIAGEDSCGDREIISFLGGLDLCDGRYDTEEHSLFQTLNSESHAHDFYQINFAGATLRRGGPREPWHDAHACVSGEAARDVLDNFEQRWMKQCNSSHLVPIKIGTCNKDRCHGIRNWNVQVFRSIDHVSVQALPDRSHTAEQSIHDAYVAAIRRAERFIYIENQYFIGGCHLWEQDQHSTCTNLIPVEIALKIAS
ncbi:uncharacterized protein A4U43_C02F14210 [Asparagus officinalis]|uniref:Phospholipase D n=1 Tax=Asparagus officinalis TaxID=4686 RepID=A0A5P1FN84_ASPOF|nr:uncharacterized protein A4U43_C02F14210 [Asparagus officinalis]